MQTWMVSMANSGEVPGQDSEATHQHIHSSIKPIPSMVDYGQYLDLMMKALCMLALRNRFLFRLAISRFTWVYLSFTGLQLQPRPIRPWSCNELGFSVPRHLPSSPGFKTSPKIGRSCSSCSSSLAHHIVVLAFPWHPKWHNRLNIRRFLVSRSIPKSLSHRQKLRILRLPIRMCLGSWVLVHLWYRSSISAQDSVKIFCFRSASSMAAFDNGVAVQGLSQRDAVFWTPQNCNCIEKMVIKHVFWWGYSECP